MDLILGVLFCVFEFQMSRIFAYVYKLDPISQIYTEHLPYF